MLYEFFGEPYRVFYIKLKVLIDNQNSFFPNISNIVVVGVVLEIFSISKVYFEFELS